MQLVKKKKGKKRPGYRGPGGYQGGATNQGGAGNPGAGTPAGGQGDGDYTGPEDFGTPEQNLNQKNVVREGRVRAVEDLIDRPTFSLDGSGKFGLGSLLTGALGLINPVAGFIGRGIAGIPGVFNTFRESNTLADFFNAMRNNNLPVDEEEEQKLLVNPQLNLPINAGITATDVFNQSPFAQADMIDINENQGFGPMP